MIVTPYVLLSIAQLCAGTTQHFLCVDWMEYCYTDKHDPKFTEDNTLEICAESLPNAFWESHE